MAFAKLASPKGLALGAILLAYLVFLPNLGRTEDLASRHSQPWISILVMMQITASE